MLLHRVSVQCARSVLLLLLNVFVNAPHVDVWRSNRGSEIRSSLPSAAREMLFASLAHSRLDYCNAVFTGLPACDIRRLQSVLNSPVRLVTGARKYHHVMSLLRDRHWLPSTERIEYKLCTLVYRCLHSNAPRYLADHVAQTSSVGGWSGLRSADTLTLKVLKTLLSFGDRASSVAGPRAWKSSHKCSLCPANVLFKKTFLNVFIPACVFKSNRNLLIQTARSIS